MKKNALRALVALSLVALVAPMAAQARDGYDRGRDNDRRERGFFSRGEETRTIVEIAVSTPELSDLVTAVVRADLADALSSPGPFTVFAPTNDAFMAAGVDTSSIPVEALTPVLLDHVAPGNFKRNFVRLQGRAAERIPTLGGLTLGFDRNATSVNGIGIISRAIPASNGTIYLIDNVLLDDPGPSIADTAIATEALSTLVSAVVRADLVETLDEGGPFTVFAPTNDAFEALGVDLDSVDDEALTNILLDHVVAGEFSAQEILLLQLTGGSLETLGGLELKFRGTTVNGNRIVADNISTSNGIVHVINGVLIED